MKRFKGTKGEWYADTHPTGHCCVCSDIEQGTVAEVMDGTHWEDDFEIKKANAQLIAVAPELLEKLIILTKKMPLGACIEEVSEAIIVINKALGL